ncbi:WXG100 family type VII secretion target [Nocardia panacis]|uniref:ESAT-6-like protein n=1 Tax=Nocardia panacis TaxID=2340916 RepID=A0A3A4K522_9NOCA|nr:WXG100 family type VII secretion target [Nocardia panacis]RJO72135.1 WXG100 family type VII secretion target [Nocardia panacis]
MTLISANFGEIAAGAESIIAAAGNITKMLEDLNGQVKSFANGKNWEGETSQAFNEFQAKWDRSVTHLNETLTSAGKLVHTGNADLESQEKSLSQMFL